MIIIRNNTVIDDLKIYGFYREIRESVSKENNIYNRLKILKLFSVYYTK